MNDWQRKQIHEAMVCLAHGDRDAFSVVFDGLWPEVLAFVTRAMPGHPDREDLAQRTMLKVFARISDFDITRDGVAWAFGIAGYEVKTLRRQMQRRRETTVDEASERVDDAGQSPEELAIQHDLRDALSSALAHLSPADREAVLTSSGRTPASIAAATWRKRRQRALDKLRAIWRQRHA